MIIARSSYIERQIDIQLACAAITLNLRLIPYLLRYVLQDIIDLLAIKVVCSYFANSLDPDQAQRNVGPDLDLNCLTLCWYSWMLSWKKMLLWEKNSTWQNTMQHYPACKESNSSMKWNLQPAGKGTIKIHKLKQENLLLQQVKLEQVDCWVLVKWQSTVSSKEWIGR